MARVAAAPVGVALGLAIGACFVKPDAPSGTTDGGSSGSDAAITDAGFDNDGFVSVDAQSCSVQDDFQSGSACDGWGSTQGSGSSPVLQNGQLYMSSNAGSGGFAACVSLVPVPFTTVVVQIAQYSTTANTRTGVILTFDDNKTFTFELAPTGTMSATNDLNQTVQFAGTNGFGYYYRFRKNGNGVTVDYSLDKSTWLGEITMATASNLGTVRVRLYANFDQGLMSANAAFDNLDACTP